MISTKRAVSTKKGVVTLIDLGVQGDSESAAKLAQARKRSGLYIAS